MSAYQQTLDFLFSQLPMYQRVGAAAMKKDLGNIQALCVALGNPEEQFKSVHLAGTNGKGSVTHIIASILQTHGLKVACYTSPHYKDFRERIKINGQLIPEDDVVAFVENNKDLITKIKPSFFEITVAMAFLYFAEQEVDVAIIETGLGGRLDSTNIITPLLSIITNIGYDHQSFLGDTLPEIAGEKAGIIKQDIPVLIGEHQPEVNDIFQRKAKSTNSVLFQSAEFAPIQDYQSNPKGSSFTIPFGKRKIHFTSDIGGSYQEKNFQTAIAAIQLLQSTFPIGMATIQAGVEHIKTNTYFVGRFTILQDEPLIIADSAHNQEGLSALLQELSSLNHNQLHFVYGTVNDKDLSEIFPILPSDANYYFCKPNVPRGLNEDKLMKEASKYGMKGKAYQNVCDALEAAKNNAAKQDLILVSGSIFVVAEVI